MTPITSLALDDTTTQQDYPVDLDCVIRHFRSIGFKQLGRHTKEPHRLALFWLFPLIDILDAGQCTRTELNHALTSYSSYLRDDRHERVSWEEEDPKKKYRLIELELARVENLRHGHRVNAARGLDVEAIVVHVLRTRPDLNTPRKMSRATGLPEQTLGRALRRLETDSAVLAVGLRGRKGQTWSLTDSAPPSELRRGFRYDNARRVFRNWVLRHPIEHCEHLHHSIIPTPLGRQKSPVPVFKVLSRPCTGGSMSRISEPIAPGVHKLKHNRHVIPVWRPNTVPWSQRRCLHDSSL
jgi:hypothetical protein